MKRVYCLAEDREWEEVGLRFAISSLLRACESARVVVYRPNPSQDFRRWLSSRPQAELVSEFPPGASSWNCKPHTLLPLLEAGADEAIWLDSDILVTRDPSFLFDGLAPDVLLGAEEFPTSPHPKGFAVRTRAWGLEPGRESPVTLNSCVVRVTRSHVPLLKRWHELLADPQYLAAQKMAGDERPFHLIGDQDLLNALLGSAPFSDFPIRFLRIGRDVIHCGGAVGYSMGRRMGDLFRRTPPFLHAIAGKPWYVFHPEYASRHSRWFTWYRRLLQETSPYVAAARRMRADVAMPCPWLDARSPLGWCMRMLGFGHSALLGFPLTLAATAALTARKSIRSM
jgi:hypothetical protein